MILCGFCQLKENNVNQEFQPGNCQSGPREAEGSLILVILIENELPFHKSEHLNNDH